MNNKLALKYLILLRSKFSNSEENGVTKLSIVKSVTHITLHKRSRYSTVHYLEGGQSELVPDVWLQAGLVPLSGGAR